MGERVSNRAILDAIENQTASMDKLIAVLTATAQQPVAAAPTTPAKPDGIDVDEAYLAHQSQKAQAHATAKGEAVVVYGRKNKAGATKIAYALRTRFVEQVSKQPSCLGAIAEFQPES